MTCCFFRSR